MSMSKILLIMRGRTTNSDPQEPYLVHNIDYISTSHRLEMSDDTPKNEKKKKKSIRCKCFS